MGQDGSRWVKIGGLESGPIWSPEEEIWTNLDLPRPEEQRCKNGWHSLASEMVRGSETREKMMVRLLAGNADLPGFFDDAKRRQVIEPSDLGRIEVFLEAEVS